MTESDSQVDAYKVNQSRHVSGAQPGQIEPAAPYVGFGPRNMTWLATVPRTGNTYLRYLLEKASQVGTGTHRQSDTSQWFQWEGHMHNVIAVKTHEPYLDSRFLPLCQGRRIITTVRDVIDSTLSLWEYDETPPSAERHSSALRHLIGSNLTYHSGIPLKESFLRWQFRSADAAGGMYFLLHEVWSERMQEFAGPDFSQLINSTHIDMKTLRNLVQSLSTPRLGDIWQGIPFRGPGCPSTNQLDSSRSNGPLALLKVRFDSLFDPNKREAELLRVLHFAGVRPSRSVALRVRCAFQHQADKLYSPSQSKHRIEGKGRRCTKHWETDACIAGAMKQGANGFHHPDIQQCIALDCSARFYDPNELHRILKHEVVREFYAAHPDIRPALLQSALQ